MREAEVPCPDWAGPCWEVEEQEEEERAYQSCRGELGWDLRTLSVPGWPWDWGPQGRGRAGQDWELRGTSRAGGGLEGPDWGPGCRQGWGLSYRLGWGHCNLREVGGRGDQAAPSRYQWDERRVPGVLLEFPGHCREDCQVLLDLRGPGQTSETSGLRAPSRS